ncbi:hypothetical protein [Klebsiella aerogenes]|uniref:Uncharacterized protein n=1 Tax=Klebsiella aerogenes TaxID=548 RepID=A0AAP9U6S6_KLEAE|nr:hypothetical protein [Klebsiella aerogenes]QMR41510.1 hypothetical protein HV331_19295 [Klebsiella aerogenes]
MNGDFPYSSREKLIRALNRPVHNEHILHQTLKHTLQGDELWSLVRLTMLIDTPGYSAGQSATLICCDLLQQSEGMWGYQSFTESNELCYFNCPLDYLVQAPVVSALWRIRVRLHHLARRTKA